MQQVPIFYSLQSDYCYFLLDRLLDLAGNGVEVNVRPVLGAVLRIPERYKDRDQLEQRYFKTDSERTAEYLGLPYAYPDPSPITFKPGSIWIPDAEQPLNEYLHRLYVGAALAGKGLAFLDSVARMLWDGSTSGWNGGNHLARAMSKADLDLEEVLANTPWSRAKKVLDSNAQAMLDAGHWGVPLMVFEGEPFYGQDRFDQLLWRLENSRD